MSDRADKSSVADWIAERNARWARERTERDEKLRAAGFKLIHCVAYHNPLTHESLRSMWMGEVETIVITKMPDGHLQYGIGCSSTASAASSLGPTRR